MRIICALHILVLLRDLHLVDQVARFDQQARLADLALRPLHVLPERTLLIAQLHQAGEDDRLQMLQRIFRLHLRPEPPPHLLRHPRLVRDPLALRLTFRRILPVIEPLQEQQIRKLLDGIQRVGESAGPEFIPEGVYLRAKARVGEHGLVTVPKVGHTHRSEGS
jgi:hypothetical protein